MPTPRPPSPPPGSTPHALPSEAAPIRVLLVDDHAALREAVRYLLNHHPLFEVCGAAAAAPEALHLARASRPQVALLDLFLEDSSGLDLARLLHLLDPGLGIVFFTMHCQAGIVRRALELGALGFVGKDEPLQHLIQALHCARRGIVYRNALVVPHLLDPPAPPPARAPGAGTAYRHLPATAADDPFDLSPWRR